jgi:hypothetical protein
MDIGTIKEALMLKPGTYRISELSDKLNKSRKTIERYVDKLQLKTTGIEHNNKLVTGIILSTEDADRVQTYIESVSIPGTEPRTSNTNTPDITLVDLITQERDSLKLQLQQALEHNKQLETRMGETIEALKTSLTVLKHDNEKMEAKLNPTINLIPAISRETIWQKLVRLIEKPVN